MDNLKKIPIEQTTLSNDFSNAYKSEVETAYTNNHTHSNKTILDTVSGSNTGDETLSTILTKVCANKVTCATACATTEKTVTLSGFSLVSGITIKVAFTNANTATSPTLNVNSTGAKAIYSEDGIVVSSTNPFYVPAGATVEFTYDGVNWIYKNRVISNYINGTSWYRIWTNGYIEQGGYFSGDLYPGQGATITLPKSYPHSNLGVFISPVNWAGANAGLLQQFAMGVNLTSFIISNSDTDTVLTAAFWRSEGY